MKPFLTRAFTLPMLAALLWTLDRAMSWMGLATAPLTFAHAMGMACALVFTLCLATGKWS